MKTYIISLVILLASIAYSQYYVKSGIFLHYKTALVDGCVVTVKVQARHIPDTKGELSAMMDEMDAELCFNEKEWDSLKFWLYINILSKLSPELKKIKNDDYEGVYFWLIEKTNSWLRDKYIIGK